jgi:hypothetical protein
MRHFLQGTVAALARGMGETARSRALIAPAGGTHRAPPSGSGTGTAAVAIAAIAARTDHPQLPATGTDEQTSDWVHRQIPADALDLLPPQAGQWTGMPCHARLGCGTGADFAVSTQCRIVLIGAAGLRLIEAVVSHDRSVLAEPRASSPES